MSCGGKEAGLQTSALRYTKRILCQVGKLARCSGARHRQRRRRVDATAVEGKLLLLFGEACTGAAGNCSSHRSKVVTDRTGISRGHITGGDLLPGRTERHASTDVESARDGRNDRSQPTSGGPGG